MKTKINKFGFEIEGEYNQEILSKLEKYGEVKTDGSLNCCQGPKHSREPFEIIEFSQISSNQTIRPRH